MGGILKKTEESENGAVQIVEATFVFPVMFIILFFLVYMGNAHYVKAQIESVVLTRTLEGAGYCADPILQTMKTTGTIPSLDNLNVEPYRYIFGGMDEIESQIGTAVESDIEDGTMLFFNNMSPRLKTNSADIAKFNNYVVYSTFSVDVEYAVEFPIRFMGQEAPAVLTINARAEVPVNDTSEFIRNTDMVIDIFYGTKFGQSISDMFGKINDFIENFAGK
ncbi:MAG TPA: pilus assembly protein [Candidatus Mediterraneibacter intestinipullorum]|nr:pilus assembly protein [Candidatus Mediterraneibacter intestinipullorum]